jgi:hypothetical protein
MKPIDEIRKLIILEAPANVCPYTSNHVEYKYIWFGEQIKYGCIARPYGQNNSDYCTLENFNDCPLFPHGEKK